MERFAFKINKSLKAQLYKICRLCGIDNPDMVSIIRNSDECIVADLDGEPELYQKIFECVGFSVTKDDKMPQQMCCLCVDKINDFYEFRETCFSTNYQTRKLLGLKHVEPQKNQIITKLNDRQFRKRRPDDVDTEMSRSHSTESIKEETLLTKTNSLSKRIKLAEPSSNNRKGLTIQQKRNQDSCQRMSNKQIKLKDELNTETKTSKSSSIVPLKSLSRFNQLCSICNQKFSTKIKLERHLKTAHLPNVIRYHCHTCSETFRRAEDIRAHQLWHKFTKTPFSCALCSEQLYTLNAYSRHLREHTFTIPNSVLVSDRMCPQCNIVFFTNFLYNTHLCSIRTLKCGGCNLQMRTEEEFKTHACHCSLTYHHYSKHILPNMYLDIYSHVIKNEIDDDTSDMGGCMPQDNDICPDLYSNLMLSTFSHINATPNIDMDSSEHKKLKKPSKKSVSRKDLKRVDDLLTSTLHALVSIKHEPEINVVDSEETEKFLGNSNLCANSNDDNGDQQDFQYADDVSVNSSIDESVNITCQPDVIIKEEYIEPEAPASSEIAVQNIGLESINKEPEDSLTAVKIPVLKIKITKEHGTLNSSIIDAESQKNEKKKKKKKRKESDKIIEKTVDTNENATECDFEPHLKAFQIKQEINHNVQTISVMNNYAEFENNSNMARGSTIMTSIPMEQFPIPDILSGENTMSFSGRKTREQLELSDVKPARFELDQLMTISNIRGGFSITDPQKEIIKSEIKSEPGSPTQESTFFSDNTVSDETCSSNTFFPKIVAVNSGVEFDQNAEAPAKKISIKSEPLDFHYPIINKANVIDCNEYLNKTNSVKTLGYNNLIIKTEPKEDVCNIPLSCAVAITTTSNSLESSIKVENEGHEYSESDRSHLVNNAISKQALCDIPQDGSETTLSRINVSLDLRDTEMKNTQKIKPIEPSIETTNLHLTKNDSLCGRTKILDNIKKESPYDAHLVSVTNCDISNDNLLDSDHSNISEKIHNTTTENLPIIKITDKLQLSTVIPSSESNPVNTSSIELEPELINNATSTFSSNFDHCLNTIDDSSCVDKEKQQNILNTEVGEINNILNPNVHSNETEKDTLQTSITSTSTIPTEDAKNIMQEAMNSATESDGLEVSERNSPIDISSNQIVENNNNSNTGREVHDENIENSSSSIISEKSSDIT